MFVVVLCSLDAVAAKPEPINWDYYAKNIAKPGMVEAFRKAVSCLYFFFFYCESSSSNTTGYFQITIIVVELIIHVCRTVFIHLYINSSCVYEE